MAGPVREGRFVSDPYSDLNSIYPLPADDSIQHITYPIAQFDHDEGNAICGGYEYQSDAIPLLKGKFLFGDIPSGRLLYIETAGIHQGMQAEIKEWAVTIDGVPGSLKKVCGSNRVDLHFGMDTKGAMYILTKSDGKLYRIESATLGN